LRLLDEGLNQSEVARRLGVGQQSVSRWAQKTPAKGGARSSSSTRRA
jgi:transposase